MSPTKKMKSNNEGKIPERPETVGAVLKEARAKKKISLEELAVATSVPTRDLERLESGDYARLPADIYVNSFLERCARELGANGDYLKELYKKETLNFKNKKEPLSASTSARSKKFIVTPKLLVALASAIGVVLLAFYLWYQLSNLLAAPFLVVESPANDIITNEETICISGRTRRDSHIFINEREVEVGAEGFFKDEFRLEAGVNTVEIKATNRFGKETILIRKIIKN